MGFEEEASVEEQIQNKCIQKGLSLALAESCTGGEIAARITKIPGASAYFKGSAVVYHSASKTALLGVEESLIAEKGVVSVEVAEAMAAGARKVSEPIMLWRPLKCRANQRRRCSRPRHRLYCHRYTRKNSERSFPLWAQPWARNTEGGQQSFWNALQKHCIVFWGKYLRKRRWWTHKPKHLKMPFHQPKR